MKKLLAICLTFIMVISVLAVPAFAATVEVPAKTVFDQSFANLTVAPAGWTVSDNATYAEKGIRPGHHVTKGAASVAYDSAFNAGKAEYTLSFELKHFSNTQYIHFGSETIDDATKEGVANTGYTFTADMNGASGAYKLYKNGELIGEMADQQAYYCYKLLMRKYSIKVTDEGLLFSGDAFNVPIQIEDNAPIKSGYVGISLANNNAEELSACELDSFKLTTEAYSYNVNDEQSVTGATASYPADCSFEQNFANLTADPVGWYTTGGTYKTSGIGQTTSSTRLVITKNETFDTNGADYTFKVKFSNYSLQQYIHFGASTIADATKQGVSDTGYTLFVDGYANGTSGYILYKNGKAITEKTTYTHGNSLKEYVLNITSTGVTLSGDVIDVPVVVVDTNPITSGYIGMNIGNNTVHSWNYPSVAYVSISSDVVKTNFLLDRTFNAGDTESELEADGFYVKDGTEFDANGAYSSDKVDIEYAGAKFGGKYTVEAKMKKATGYQIIRVIKNGDSYYELKFGNNECTVTKVINGKIARSWDVNTASSSYLFTYTTTAFTINVSEESDGSVKISYEAIGSGTLTGEIIDTPTAENKVLVSGNVQLEMTDGSASNRHIKSFKVYPTSVANPAYEGNFDIEGSIMGEAVKGITYFTFPVTMLGQSPDFIAALYENGKVSDVKIFDAADVNAGAVKIFDTTNSKALKVEIKVFVWDTLKGMIPVLAPFTLD